MGSVLLLLAIGVQSGEREPHPLAPSIPLLSKEEIRRVEDIIERFIQYDIGKLKGAAGKKALEDFNLLGRESIFQLIDGFNRGANMESSCPCVIIAKKISKILNTSDDIQLLTFARENLGVGVTAKRHMAVVEDLRVAAMLRRTAVSRKGPAPPLPSVKNPLPKKSVDELADLVRARDKQSKAAVEELGRRNEQKVADVLGEQEDAHARSVLQKWVGKQEIKEIGELLKHRLAPVREAAAQAAKKHRSLTSDLIRLLADNEVSVGQAARQSLIHISSGSDYGPVPTAGIEQRDESIARWRAWLDRQKK